MTLRTSLKRLVGRDTPAQTLRERAATVRAGIAATKPSTDVTAAADPLPQADPVLTAIEAVRGCLRVCKAAQRLPQPPGRLDPLPEQEAAGEALHASLDVLAQTVPATAQGCAALARFAIEFHGREGFAVDENEHGQQHLRILDLIARSPALGTDMPVDQPSAAPVQATYGIAERVDFDTVTLEELRTIHEKMRHLSDVAHAMASQGCCRSEDRSPFGNPHNAAGELMHWIGDALTDVESAAADELTHRQPTSMDDRATRLAAIAERIIFNGNDEETAAFVRDLAGFAAEQAGR